jgi:hypothetical protein
VKGKVAKAVSKIKTADCGGSPPAAIPGLVIVAADIDAIMLAKELALLAAIFGDDLDASFVLIDPNDKDATKDAGKCQAAVIKAVGKCQDAKLKSFNKCKKDLLKNDPNAQPQDLQDTCMGTGTTIPGNSIPDTKGKIAKKCTDFATVKKCATDDWALFPGLDPNGVSVVAGIDAAVECEVCKALNLLDGLARDCDEFDNGAADLSCVPPPECVDATWPTCAGMCDLGEVCAGMGDGSCQCVTAGQCEGTYAICNGTCSGGDVCANMGDGTCQCVTPGSCQTTYPTCDGPCPPGEMCIDTGTCVCQAPAPLDHFRLYTAMGWGPPEPAVTLDDQFQSQAVDLGDEMYFGVPASKNGEPIFDPEVHMTGNAILGGSFSAIVGIDNQFGLDTLVIGDPRMLLVPTQKLMFDPNATLIPLVRDHYKCYQILDSSLDPNAVLLVDQLNPVELEVEVGPAREFCAPVDKNGEGIANPDEHLTCYETVDSAVSPPDLYIRNQFHEALSLGLAPAGPADRLCVPTAKLYWDPPLPQDHFRVYDAFGLMLPQFVSLLDQFGPLDTFVEYVMAFMPPVVKDPPAVPPLFNPGNHLTCYALTGPYLGWDVLVRNQFGEHPLVVYEPAMLCLPSDKIFPDDLLLADPFGEHYMCYWADGPSVDKTVTLTDQFLQGEEVDVWTPAFFCNPVSKLESEILDPETHLTCYFITPVTLSPVSFALALNQFLIQEITIIDESVALCVPSRKLEVLVP